MSKTPFSKKCEILGELWITWGEEDVNDEVWKKYFQVYDLGLPLAYFVRNGLAMSTPDGEKYVNDAWDMLGLVISVDANESWDSLDEMFSASPNPPVIFEDEEDEDEDS